MFHYFSGYNYHGLLSTEHDTVRLHLAGKRNQDYTQRVIFKNMTCQTELHLRKVGPKFEYVNTKYDFTNYFYSDSSPKTKPVNAYH